MTKPTNLYRYSYKNQTLFIFQGENLIFCDTVEEKEMVEDTIAELMENGVIA